MEKIKVICLHENEMHVGAIKGFLEKRPEIDCMEIVNDEKEALVKIKTKNPDVIILDTNFNNNAAMIFLERLFKYNPKPVILMSSLDKINKERTLKGLQMGAVDVIIKPGQNNLNDKNYINTFCEELLWKIKIAKTSTTRLSELVQHPNKIVREMIFDKATRTGNKTSEKIIAIGSSTGGTEVIAHILKNLTVDLPGIVIVQHMPKEFTALFAERLDIKSSLKVKEAQDGDIIYNGHVYIAQGNMHLVVKKREKYFFIEINDDPPVKRFKPSVDKLFHSVALAAGGNSVGIILTGMGSDGVEGMAHMKEQGAITIAQDRETCVVFGMPRVAVEQGAAERVESVEGIINFLNGVTR